MKSNQPPFAINQRVVCIESGSNGSHKVTKGNIYRVLDILQCSCGIWGVDVGLRCGLDRLPKCPCGKIRFNRGVVYADATLFAPYDPPKVEIPAELLEVDTKDGIDVIKEKELV